MKQFWHRDRRHVASTFQDQGRAILDAIFIAAAAVVAYAAIHKYDLFEWLYEATRAHENLQIDEIAIVVLLSVVALGAFAVRRLQDQRREIKARQKAEDRARRLALADALTGLPNRRQFERRLTESLAALAGTDNQCALLMIDLDRFKPVNDVFGHAVGDQVLTAFAKRVAALEGPNAVFARFGGDEFALLLAPVTGRDEPTRVARRLLAVFDRPFAVGDAQVSLGASVGIAIAPNDGANLHDIMRRADIALYRAKSNGRGTFCFFEQEMDAQVKRRAQIERDLRLAIETSTVQPYYQPIVDLGTGKITAFEALARWDHPEFGEIEPEQFIAIAEDGGLIVPLSTHLLRIAAREATRWPSHVRLCFNISRVQLADPTLVLRTLQILGETGLSPTRLEIEISEQALLTDIVAAKAALNDFHNAGVRIALDDFGTGNSSLQHLRQCRFDRLKIDRSFVRSMAKSSEDASLVNAILGLSKALGLPVTAEGIEDTALIESLIDNGCGEGQGFSFSEALPADDALALLHGQAPARASA